MESTVIRANDAIVRGTTPTLEFVYSDITVGEIVKAVLTVKQDRRTVIEKTLDQATVYETSIAWTLTQEETLQLREQRDAVITCDWKLSSGTRGRSRILIADVEDSGKNEVI